MMFWCRKLARTGSFACKQGGTFTNVQAIQDQNNAARILRRQEVGAFDNPEDSGLSNRCAYRIIPCFLLYSLP